MEVAEQLHSTERMGERARAQVIAKHLWIHRAQQILNDLDRA